MIPFLLEKANKDIDIFYTLMGEATALTNLGKNLQVIESYDEIIDKFKNTKDTTIEKFLAFAYYNKALIHGNKKSLKKN